MDFDRAVETVSHLMIPAKRQLHNAWNRPIGELAQLAGTRVRCRNNPLAAVVGTRRLLWFQHRDMPEPITWRSGMTGWRMRLGSAEAAR